MSVGRCGVRVGAGRGGWAEAGAERFVDHRYAGVVAWIGLLWHLIGMLADVAPSGLMAGSAAMVGLLFITVLAARVLIGEVAEGCDPRAIGQGLRERARRMGVPRHRDPDACGRSRPRAPTTVPAAA